MPAFAKRETVQLPKVTLSAVYKLYAVVVVCCGTVQNHTYTAVTTVIRL